MDANVGFHASAVFTPPLDASQSLLGVMVLGPDGRHEWLGDKHGPNIHD